MEEIKLRLEEYLTNNNKDNNKNKIKNFDDFFMKFSKGK